MWKTLNTRVCVITKKSGATHQQKSDASALVLIQQLRLIVELLPQLQTLVAKEKRYHQQEEIENKAD